MRQFPFLCLFLCTCSSEDPRQVQAARDRSVVDSIAQQVRGTPQVAVTGRWDLPQLTRRLVDAGLAPRPDDSLPPHPDYRVKPAGFRVGGAHLLAWIFADSLARRTVSATIDTLTAFPRAEGSAFDALPMFVLQNNLIAVVVGGNERQRERIRLAVEAGLPAPP